MAHPIQERLGTAALWIEVPDLSQPRLRTSSLLVGDYPPTKEADVVIEGFRPGRIVRLFAARKDPPCQKPTCWGGRSRMNRFAGACLRADF